MRRYRPILAVLLVAAAALSWWLLQQPRTQPERQVAQPGAREVDYVITGFDVTRMTEVGKPAHRLQAAKLRHFTDDDTSELERPQLTVYQNDQPPWQVNSARAWLSADGELVLLSGTVVIERDAHLSAPATRIVTRDLRVQPGQDYAETDEHVRVETDVDWLEAVGMQAWLRPPSRIRFLSRVKGYYVPR